MIFLSYAEEDSAKASQIAVQLKEAGFEVFDWQDPHQRGTRWINAIEKGIGEAFAFLALVSQSYLVSPWCSHEREMALRREAAEFTPVSAQFIWVLQVGPCERTGFLASYDWLALTGPNEESVLTSLVEKLKNQESAVKTRVDVPPSTLWPAFQNRRQELDGLRNHITNISGEHFHLVLAAPQMGKSWLLQQLAVELSELDPTWKIVRVDLREQPADVRSSGCRLLGRFFNLDLDPDNETENSIQCATTMLGSGVPWLLLLDSAELLDENSAVQFRDGLSAVYARVRNGGLPDVRLALVAASRRRFRAWKGILPPPRFSALTLTHFDTVVIEKALRDMAHRDSRAFDNNSFKQIASSLSRVTEGLPALLIRYMQRIREKQYVLSPHEIEERALFDQLAVPYIKEHLLSANSLLPFTLDSGLAQARRSMLEQVLLGLSSYRLITESHLKKIYTADPMLRKTIAAGKWDRDGVWEALLEAAIVEPALGVWTRAHPAIRRVLFRYHYDTRQKQTKIHRLSAAFMEGWWQDFSGTDKGIILLERLWHQIERLRLSRYQGKDTRVLTFAKKLFETGVRSNHHTDKELVFSIEQNLYDDPEIQTSLHEIAPDLFTRLLDVLQSTLP